MTAMQLRRTTALSGQVARQFAARPFSTRTALQQEIRDAYILSAARTPTAKFNGSYTTVPAPKLGAVAIKSALEKSKVPVSKITDVYMGNVLQGSVGQSPARQAAIFAGLPSNVEAITINKVCASGLKAVVMAAQNIQLGLSEAQIAGGMENMTRMEDGLIKDGLTDAYDDIHMGICAESTAKKYGITREMQDQYTVQSYERAQAAWKANAFDEEIAPVTVSGRKGDTIIKVDEGFNDVKLEKLPTLKPAFVRDGTGTVTAASSSTLNDGASALVLGSKEIAREYGSGSRVLAKICGSADAAVDPIDFPIAPASAVPIALKRAGITKDQVAIWEFNEAFAAVIKANEKILGLENAKVNPLGGAISLGHALGSSGSRILTTLLHQLKPGEYGVAAICNGGGAATALVVQRIEAFVRQQNGDELRNWLLVEPNASQTYHNLAAQLRTGFRQQDSTALEQTIEKCLPEDDDVSDGEATPWPGFVTFMKDYLLFWRDVDFDNLLAAHTLLSGLVNSCGTAFAHPTYGGMLLKTAMSLCETMSRLTMMVSRRPDLTMRLRNVEADDRKSIAETSAEIIQKIFTTCLTDRTSARYSKPEGKKIGVYMFANLVLKLLFACRRTQLAKQIFTNISSNSPPLSLYPAAQRVTFLFYLGRFNLSNSHYVRASLCLQEGYSQTPAPLVSHRHRILTYLIPANLFLGRLPTQTLLSRPEASDKLAAVFAPLASAIRQGDFVLYQHTLAAHEDWLFERGLLLPLTHRLRPLLWRSLARRTFLLTYALTDADTNADPNVPARKAATLDLADLQTAAAFQQRRLQGWHAPPARARPAHVSAVFMRAVANDTHSTLVPPDGGPKRLRPNEGLVCGDADVTRADVEMMVASLIAQGLMKGYIAHSSNRFAVLGATKRSPVVAGWPTPWSAIHERKYHEGDVDLEDVPGWVKG
ncbi:Acetyl-CoA acetyltransferase like protein [Verticillium longisporum]|uniref:acetyl-CoA C-acetyltransferase n=1 Tax=Verticillium longisporum TaxID=100787 RepID=A0A8I2ZAH1_VERLO|nr:Acetyl-CoA acetyltransferase like protein [Verticillium longisporum]